ncbi:MAG: sortase [Streptococcaceae bacterium]|jgi:hypothetical protein|nr:sortase [Streptococcaceae bacterium]
MQERKGYKRVVSSFFLSCLILGTWTGCANVKMNMGLHKKVNASVHLVGPQQTDDTYNSYEALIALENKQSKNTNNDTFTDYHNAIVIEQISQANKQRAEQKAKEKALEAKMAEELAIQHQKELEEAARQAAYSKAQSAKAAQEQAEQAQIQQEANQAQEEANQAAQEQQTQQQAQVAQQNTYAPDTIYLNGNAIPYVNAGQGSGQAIIDANPNGTAATWGGASVQSGSDGLNTHFIGHNYGAFTCLLGANIGDVITITDGASNPTSYVVNDIRKSDNDGYELGTGADLMGMVAGVGGGERVTLQTCFDDFSLLFVFANAG